MPGHQPTLQRISASYKRILVKFYGRVESGPMTDDSWCCRTFQESEVKNMELRHDLYDKMISLNACEPTSDEHDRKAITKLRYMQVRSVKIVASFYTVHYSIKWAVICCAYVFVSNFLEYVFAEN